MAEDVGKKQGRRGKRRKRNRTLYYILIMVILLTAGAALSLTVFFKIESVAVVGADKYPPDDIVKTSGISAGDNLFRVNGSLVKDKLLAEYPYIENVAVKHKLPNSILLEITQHKPAAAISDGGELLLITNDGKVLERGILLIPESVPLAKGIAAENTRPGETLGDNAADALRMLDYLFKAARETDFGEITNVDVSDIYNMKIVYENRLLLNLGTESALVEKLNFLKEMIKNRLPYDAQGLIDASNVSRSLIYTEMTLEDAQSGKKYTPKKARQIIEEQKESGLSEQDLEESANEIP